MQIDQTLKLLTEQVEFLKSINVSLTNELETETKNVNCLIKERTDLQQKLQMMTIERDRAIYDKKLHENPVIVDPDSLIDRAMKNHLNKYHRN